MPLKVKEFSIQETWSQTIMIHSLTVACEMAVNNRNGRRTEIEREEKETLIIFS